MSSLSHGSRGFRLILACATTGSLLVSPLSSTAFATPAPGAILKSAPTLARGTGSSGKPAATTAKGTSGNRHSRSVGRRTSVEYPRNVRQANLTPIVSPTSPAPTPSPSPTPSPTGGSGSSLSRDPILFGVSAASKAQIQEHEASLGRTVGGVRVFRRWGDQVIQPDMQWASDGGRTLFLSIKTHRSDGTVIPYADVAAAAPGSALHADMVSQAQQLAAFGRPVYVAYQHEPEVDTAAGTATQFIAAWRNWVQIYRSVGVPNVTFIWTMTGFAFARSDAKAASYYWPGADVVDAIGADTYNFYNCSNPSGSWPEPRVKIDPIVAFAKQYPTLPVVLMEFSSVEDPAVSGRKATWLTEFTGLLRDPKYAQVTAVLQWSGRNFGPSTCDFDYLTSESSAAAMRAIAQDPLFAARW